MLQHLAENLEVEVEVLQQEAEAEAGSGAPPRVKLSCLIHMQWHAVQSLTREDPLDEGGKIGRAHV